MILVYSDVEQNDSISTRCGIRIDRSAAVFCNVINISVMGVFRFRI